MMPPRLVPDSMGCQVEVAERLSVSCSNDTSTNHSNARELLETSTNTIVSANKIILPNPTTFDVPQHTHGAIR
ncbi:hypothetical protein CaCOL14_004919 [Colletotrichum acutatum]